METKYGGCEQLAAASAGFVANSTDGWLTDRAYPDMRVVSSSFKPPAKTLPAILAVDSKSSGMCHVGQLQILLLMLLMS